MAQETELISQYVDREAIQRDTDFLLNNLKKVQEVLNNLASTGVSLGNSKTNKETFDGIQKSRQAMSELSLAVGEHKKIVDGIVKSQARLNALSSESAREYAKEKEALRLRNLELKNQVREENAAKGSLEQRRAALIRLQKEYDNLSPKERDTSWGVRLQATIKGVSDQLKVLEGGTGRFQRDVGNYKKGFDGLGASVAQMTRELPAFTNSVQTGFLALSNNVPLFFDALKNAKNEIKAMRAEGKETQGLLNRLAGSFFSFGTVLSIGITLLTVYGKEIGNFFSALLKGRHAMDQFSESQKLLGESLKQTSGPLFDAVKSVSELKINIDLAKRGLLDKKKVVDQYNDTVGETAGKVTTLEEAEKKLIENGPAYVRMMLYKSSAQLALEKAATKALEAEEKRRKKEEEFLTTGDKLQAFGAANSSAPGFVPNLNDANNRIAINFTKEQSKKRKDAAIKASEDERKTFEDIANQFQKDASEIATKFKFDFFGGEGGKETALKSTSQKFFTDELKAQAEGYKKLSEQDSLQQTTRINARKRAADIEASIIEGQRDTEIRNEIEKLAAVKNQKDVSANEITNATREFNAAVSEINQKAAFDLTKIEQDKEGDILDIKGSSVKRQRDLDKKYHEDSLAALIDAETKKKALRLKTIDDEKNRRLNNLSANRDEELLALEKRFAAGKISQKKYDRERLEIEADYNARLLQVELDYAKQLLAIRQDSGEDVTAQQKRINELELQLARAHGEKKKKLDDDEVKRLQEKINRIKEISIAYIDAAAAIAGGFVERDKNKIQEEIDDIEKRKEKEIEAVNASLETEQQKADKIAIIEARAQARKEALERRQRQLDQERARFEKAAGIARIVVNTASGIMAALATVPPNVPLAFTIGAVGAAELATAIATPIPKYKDGTKDKRHPGGLAIVGDGGRQELVIMPSGEGYATPDKPTLVNLPKGAEVFPNLMDAMKLNLLLAKPQMMKAPAEKNNLDDLRRDINGLKYAVVQAIKNKKEFHSSVTHEGLIEMERHVNSWIEYIDKRINF